VEDQVRSEVLKTIPYGFYITGVIGTGGEANGFTICWVSQVSFEPQQVVLAVRKDQHTHNLIETGGVFSLNFLDTSQEDLTRKFTQPLRPEDGTVGLPLHPRRGDRRPALRGGLRPFGVPGCGLDGGRRPHRLPGRNRRRQPQAPR
jgi:flavin reductase (DIM6/NTAB) family NADH-FMN oxidoreductase RutF